ncbi:MbeB family mobilization protein, partial [Klebsiella quasipneumoniae]|uniref:MbeB family mobilization protein n=1 Tax=Klebsiella quasipneumoniae TaxID=1463165 RepID=UPI0038904E68
MNSLLTLAKDLEQKSKAQQQSTGEMLKAAFRAREVCQSGTERKREENQRRHPRPRPEAVLSHEPAHERDAAHGQP